MSKFSLLEFSKNLQPQFRDFTRSYPEVKAFLVEYFQTNKECFLAKCFTLKLSIKLSESAMEELSLVDLEKLYSFSEAVVTFLYYDLEKLKADSTFKPLELQLSAEELKVRQFSDADKDDFNSISKKRALRKAKNAPLEETQPIIKKKTLAEAVKDREALRLVDPNVIDLRHGAKNPRGKKVAKFPNYKFEEVLEDYPNSVFSENSTVSANKGQKLFNQQQAFNYQYQVEQEKLPAFNDEEGFAYLVWLSCGLELKDLYLEDREAIIQAKRELYHLLFEQHNKLYNALKREREELLILDGYEKEISAILNHKDTINIAQKTKIEQEYHKALKASGKKVKDFWKERDYSRDFTRKTNKSYSYTKKLFDRDLTLSAEEREVFEHRKAIAKEQCALKIIPLDLFSEEDLSLLPLDQTARFWARVREREEYYLTKLKEQLQAEMPLIEEEYYKACKMVEELNKKGKVKHVQPDPLVFLYQALEAAEKKGCKQIQENIKEQMRVIFDLLRRNKEIEEKEALEKNKEKASITSTVGEAITAESLSSANLEAKALSVESPAVAQAQETTQASAVTLGTETQVISSSAPKETPSTFSIMGIPADQQDKFIEKLEQSNFTPSNELKPELEAAILQRIEASEALLEAKNTELREQQAQQSRKSSSPKPLPSSLVSKEEDANKAQIISKIQAYMSKEKTNPKDKEHIQLILKALQQKGQSITSSVTSTTDPKVNAFTEERSLAAVNRFADKEQEAITVPSQRSSSEQTFANDTLSNGSLPGGSLSGEEKRAKQRARAKARKARAKARKKAQALAELEEQKATLTQDLIPENPEYLDADHPYAEDGKETLLAASNQAFNQEGRSLNSKDLKAQRKEGNSQQAREQKALAKELQDFTEQQELEAQAKTSLASLDFPNHQLEDVFDISEDLSIISKQVKKVSSQVNSLDELHAPKTSSPKTKSSKKAAPLAAEKVVSEGNQEAEVAPKVRVERVSLEANDPFALDPKAITAPPKHRQQELPEAKPLEVRVEQLNKIVPQGLEIAAPYVIPEEALASEEAAQPLTYKQRKLLTTIEQNLETVADPLEMEVALAVESSLQEGTHHRKKGAVPLEQRELKDQLVQEKAGKRKRRRRGKKAKSLETTTVDTEATLSSNEILALVADSQHAASAAEAPKKRKKKRRSRNRKKDPLAASTEASSETPSSKKSKALATNRGSDQDSAKITEVKETSDSGSSLAKRKRRRRKSSSQNKETVREQVNSKQVSHPQEEAPKKVKPRRKKRGKKASIGEDNSSGATTKTQVGEAKTPRPRRARKPSKGVANKTVAPEPSTPPHKKSVVKKFIKKIFGG